MIYVRGNDRLHMAYNSELMENEPFSYTRLRNMIQRIEAQFQDGVICWTAGTHDFPRLKSRWQKHQPSDRCLDERSLAPPPSFPPERRDTIVSTTSL